MAITTSKVARLSFSTVGGQAFSITISNPREDLTQAEVLTVMDTIVSSDIFFTSGGALTGTRDVKIIDTTTNDLFDAP
ncbi:DUF2922 domain-containing protein [Desulfitobacterium sp. THU1]|uniref:DUF2922 domain-containing protein n=1 Tax=Desulfitobacterium sp. THU1 TaxID=3138072 RepID=UPI00311D9402